MQSLIKRNRSGFTLVELLVVIAVIGILIGMLMPAVQMVREAARRTDCLNKVRQLGIAVQQYHDTNRYYPPARIGNDTENGFLTWPVFIMPFLESNNLYEKFDIQARYRDQDPEALATPLEVMLCPSRRRIERISSFESNGAPVGAVGDYAGNGGTSEYLPLDRWAAFDEPVNGVFNSGWAKDHPLDSTNTRVTKGPKGRYSQKNLQDGAGNIIFIGEKMVDVNNFSQPGGWGDGSIYHGDEPGTTVRIGGYGCDINFSATSFGAPGPGTIPVWGAAHPGVSNFLFGDGHVKPLAKDMDPETLRRLSSRNDGLIVTVD